MKKMSVYILLCLLAGFMIVTFLLALVNAPEATYVSSESAKTSIVISTVVGFVGTVYMYTIIIGLNIFYFLYETKKVFAGIILRISSILLSAMMIFCVYYNYFSQSVDYSVGWAYFSLIIQYAARIAFFICVIERLRKLPGYFRSFS